MNRANAVVCLQTLSSPARWINLQHKEPDLSHASCRSPLVDFHSLLDVRQVGHMLSLTVSAGGEVSGDEAHTLLPDALWESPVQQPSVEELECAASSSDENHWKQLQWHDGQVGVRHE